MDTLIDGHATFEAETNGIIVTAQCFFIEGQSDPEKNQYAWAYRIRIHNESQLTVQLLTRHWVITDALGRQTEVEGEGVIGEQPILAPGESHVYSSGTPLPTPTGFMTGSYGMRREDGVQFKVKVPTFSLDSPYQEASVN